MNEALLERVLASPKIPSLPAVALQVIELTSDRDVSMKELAQVIEKDQGLATKILKTVNSAFYGLSKPCSSLTHAQTLLGLNAVKTLALGFTLVDTLNNNEEKGFDYVAYWRRAVLSAVGAKTVTAFTKSSDSEEAFLGGLLQDIGMIAMAMALADEYQRIARACRDDHSALARKELELFELQHTEVGAMLADRWKLPHSLIAPIRYHERPSAAPTAHQALVRAVALGGMAADVVAHDDRAAYLSTLYRRANEWFSLSATQTDEILESAVEGGKEIASLLDLDVGALPSPAEILGQASERLSDMAMEESQAFNRMAEENQDLQRALMTDSLTGLLSRRAFSEMSAAAFAKARDSGEPVSLIFIDLDSFRRINDELGREVGDVALARIGARLGEAASGDNASVFRYGGEQFAVMVHGADRQAASGLADSLRRMIADADLRLNELVPNIDRVRLTASVGVSCLDATTSETLTRVERLINAADKAVHAAKGAGGNCVRVFKPLRKAA